MAMRSIPPRAINIIHLKNLTFLALVFIMVSVSSEAARVFNVEQYGAVGDGRYDSTKAFQQAWSVACKTPSATLLVPRSRTFYVNNIAFEGPCQNGFIFQIDGTIIAPEDPRSWSNKNMWLSFDRLQNFVLSGGGTIDGRGFKWWQNVCSTNNGRKFCNDQGRPTAIHFNNAQKITINGLHATNSPITHFSFSNCDTIHMTGVSITAPKTSPNTDGIDLVSSKNFLIQSCTIASGDDCVGIADGSSNIKIKDMVCGPGHGISIGSLGKGNTPAAVSQVHVDGAKLIGTTNGLRIKTWQGGSGLANDIIYENVEMVNVMNPIIIDQSYCNLAAVCGNQRSAVQISEVTYKNIRGTSATQAGITFDCSAGRPCTGIQLIDVQLKLPSGAASGAVCRHANVQSIGNSRPVSCGSR